MLFVTANSSRTIDELEGDSCIATLLRARRAGGGRYNPPWPNDCRLARARAQRPRRECTRHAPLRGYVRVLVRRLHCCTVYSSSRSSQSQPSTPNTKTGGSSALATCLCRQTRDGQPYLERLGPTRSAAHPARLFAAPNHKDSTYLASSLFKSLYTKIKLTIPHR